MYNNLCGHQQRKNDITNITLTHNQTYRRVE